MWFKVYQVFAFTWLARCLSMTKNKSLNFDQILSLTKTWNFIFCISEKFVGCSPFIRIWWNIKLLKSPSELWFLSLVEEGMYYAASTFIVQSLTLLPLVGMTWSLTCVHNSAQSHFWIISITTEHFAPAGSALDLLLLNSHTIPSTIPECFEEIWF